jgi:ribonuclease Z
MLEPKNYHNPFTFYLYVAMNMTQLQLIFLGTGGSWPSVKRNVSSIAIKRGSEILLFDCGEGTQRQFQKSHLSYMQIKNIFITHYHGDHFLGLPGLIQTMQLNDRDIPLHIYGPEGIHDLVNDVVSLGYFKPTYEILSHEVADSDIVDFKEFEIHVLKVSHGVPSLAYSLVEKERPGKFNKPKALELNIPEGPLFSKLQKGQTIKLKDGTEIHPEMVMGPKRPGRKIVYSGDTRPVETMIEFAKHADVLIHEGTFDSSLNDISYQYGHSTVEEAAIIAKNAEVKMLFITHISPRYYESEDLKKEAEKKFNKVIIPKDFDTFTIPLKK